MGRQVAIEAIAGAVSGNILYKGDYEHVNGVVASGLMSDVLVSEEEGILLVSNLSTPQVVRTADMVGAYAILITNGKMISDDMKELAEELAITLLHTDMSMFDVCYKLGKILYER
jgi:predicted transcriptional regulator